MGIMSTIIGDRSTGDHNLRKKEYQTAIKYYNQALIKDPKDYKALRGKGRAFNNLKKYEEAYHCFTQALEIYKIDEGSRKGKIDSLLGLGEENLDNGNFSPAFTCFQEVLEINHKDSSNFLKKQGNAEFIKGKASEILAGYLDEFLGIKKGDIKALRGMGWASLGLEEYQNSIDYFDSVLRIRSKDIEALWGKGRAFLELDEQLHASVVFNTILKYDPKNLDVLKVQSNLSFELENYEEALDYYNRILDKEKIDQEAEEGKKKCLILLGDRCLKEREYSQALTYYQDYLLIDSQNHHVLMGKIESLWDIIHELMNFNKFNQAILNVDDALATLEVLLDSDLPQDEKENIQLLIEEFQKLKFKSLLEQGKTYLQEKNLGKASQSFQDAYNITPHEIASSGIREALLGLGNQSLGSQNYTQALDYFQKILEVCPKDYDTLIGKTFAFNGLKQYKDSLDLCNELIKINKSDERVLYCKKVALSGRGCQYLNKNNYQNALDYFHKALTLESNDIKSLIGNGLALYGLKKFDDALESFNLVLKYESNNSHALEGRLNSLIGQGNALLHNKNYESALNKFKSASSINQHNPEVLKGIVNSHTGIGFNLQDEEHCQDALSHFDLALEIEPHKQEAISGKVLSLVGIANKELENKNYIQASKFYEQAEQLDHGNKDVSKGRSKIYVHQANQELTSGDHNKALILFDKALQYYPNNEDSSTGRFKALIVLGEEMLKSHNFDDALQSFNNALKIQKSNEAVDGKIKSLLGKADKLVESHNYQTALNLFNEVLSIEPQNLTAKEGRIRVLTILALSNLKGHNYTKSLEQFQTIHQEKPNELPILYGMASSLEGLNQFERALESYEHILKLNPYETNAEEGKFRVLLALGQKLFDKNELENALSYYQEALDINFNHKDALLGKALLLNSLGKFKEAREILDYYIKKYPDDQTAFKGRIVSLKGIAYWFLESNEYNSALEEFEEILKLDNSDDDALNGKSLSLIGLGNIHLRNKRFDEALQTFDSALVLKGDRAAALSGKASALVGIGNIQLKNHLFDKSLETFIQALECNPENPEAEEGKFQSLLGKGNALINKSDYEIALKIFNDCLTTQPNHPEVLKGKIKCLIGIGNQYLGKQDFNSSLKIFNEITEMDHENLEANSGKTKSLIGLGNFYLDKTSFHKSLTYYQDALKIEPHNKEAISGMVKSLIIRGNYQLKGELFEDALESFQQVIEIDEGNIEALDGKFNSLVGKAQQLIKYHDLNLALEHYNDALGIKYDAKVLKSKTLVLIDLEKYTEASSLIDELLIKFSDDDELLKAKSKILSVKGKKLLQKKSFQLALKEFEQSLNLDPENKDSCAGKILCFVGIGDELLEKGEYCKAIKYYECALLLEPENHEALSKKIEAYNLKATQYIESNKFKKAFKTFNIVLKRDSSNLTAIEGRKSVLTQCGITFLDMGEFLTSLRCFNLILQDFPLDKTILVHKQEALNHVGNQLLGEKKYTRALKVFNESLNISETSDAINGKLKALNCAGEQWAQKGFLEKARDCYQHILDLDPLNTRGIKGKIDMELLIGDKNIQNSDYEKAGYNFREVLERDENNIKALLGCLTIAAELNLYPQLLTTSKKILKIEPENSQAKKQELNALLHLARVYYTQQKYEDALKKIDELLSKDSKNFKALLCKGFTLKKLSDFEAAIKIFGECLEINHKNPDAVKGKLNSIISRGNLYLKDLKFNEALKDFETALVIDPSNNNAITGKVSSLIGIGKLYCKKGENQQAIDTYQMLLEIDPENLQAHLGIGAAYLKHGDFQESYRYFEKAYKFDSNNRKAIEGKLISLIKIGFTEIEKGEYNKALKSFDAALEMESDNQQSLDGKKTSLLCLAKQIFEEKDYSKALSLYIDVLKIDPKNYEALKGQIESLVAIGNELLNSDNYHDAYAKFEDALDLNKDYSAAKKGIVLSLTGIAQEYLEEKEISKALESYEEILNFEPDNPIAYTGKHNILIEKGYLALENKKYHDALKYFDEASYIRDTKFVRGKALSLYGLGKFKEAIIFFDEVIEENPDDDLLLKKIKSLYNLKSYDVALKLVDQLIKSDKNNINALILKARILFILGRKLMALTHINKAIDIDPNLVDALVFKGEIFSDQGEYEKALECFEKGLELDPENRDIIHKKMQVEFHLKPESKPDPEVPITPDSTSKPTKPKVKAKENFTQARSTRTTKKISQVHFGMLSPDDIRKMSVTRILIPDTYDENGYPIETGLMDPRLGVIDPGLRCRTCGSKGGDCQGHFGHITLARPVIHVGFADTIHKILRSTCSECGRVLLTETEKIDYQNQIKTRIENDESITGLVKDVYNTANRYNCPHCDNEQEYVNINKPVSIVEGNYKLTPGEVRERLERISEEDYIFLGINSDVARPEWMVLTVLPVPPVTVRPTVIEEKTGQRIEDDLTHKLVDILRINQRLKENMEAGAPDLITDDLWELLQYHVTTYFDNEAFGIPPARHRSGRPLKTLLQRLKGKDGRFQSKLYGNRVDFSACSVLTPDPNISINEVGVPEMIATEVTVPLYITKWNIEEVKKYVLNGPNQHPGANYVIRPDDRKIRVFDETKEAIIDKLEPGFVVERHLKDGDIVLINQQPSPHRMSMMAHEVKVFPQKTIGLNPAVYPSYRDNLDRDEVNIHVIQSIEARAEAKNLMGVQENIISPRHGVPIIGGVSDYISGAYLLTEKNSVFNEDQVFQMLKKSNLPLPSTRKKEWTGKEVFSLLLPDDLNIKFYAEICRHCEECLLEACKNDAYVQIVNGQLKSGVIDKAALGAFSGEILNYMLKEYGNKRTSQFLDSVTKLTICSIMKRGLTTSSADEEITQEAKKRIESLLNKAEEKVETLIEAYHDDDLEDLTGFSPRESLEMKTMQLLVEAREKAGEIAESCFGMDDHAVIMALSGARGSMLNLAQIAVCVGQQTTRNGRINKGYNKRSLPHFMEGELSAKACGFIRSSYKTGLDPREFFFHAINERESEVNSHFSLSNGGYMRRRLIYALHDLFVRSDGSVRDGKGMIIQNLYGEDGIDPAKTYYGEVVNIDSLIEKIRGIKNRDYSKSSIRRERRQINNIEFDHYFIDYYQTKERHGLYQNKFSKDILLFKNVNAYHYKKVADTFSEEIINIIKDNDLNFDVIMPIPSSTKGRISEGNARLAANLSERLGIKDGTGWLERIKTVPKSHIAGSRTIEEHLNSMYCKDFNDKNVLLFDDIYTHGNTAKSCILKINETHNTNITLITLAKTPTKR
ncbi:DNA-directed RNA polymerase subunit A' [Methanobacterium subterraneum]|uniref:DNA-directed RNA polymerase subunit Rpo1N n=1 Tax=Methanobacterium subterraneum TaxID=59277 RepID=A0A2H4VE11_9EURY|nr:DNA-directed RNA polymerase subunit A' [Methanobacterium subterraneum]